MSRAAAAVGGRRGEGRRGRAREPSYPHSSSPMEREDDVDLAEKCFNDVAVKIEQGAVPNDRVTGKRRREDDVDEDDTSETDGGGGEDVGDQDSHDCNQNGAGDDHDDGSLTSPSPSKRSRSS